MAKSKKKPYSPPQCPKCYNKRTFIYCPGNNGYCEWRLRSQYHPWHERDEAEAFHVTCTTCHFKEVIYDVAK